MFGSGLPTLAEIILQKIISEKMKSWKRSEFCLWSKNCEKNLTGLSRMVAVHVMSGDKWRHKITSFLFSCKFMFKGKSKKVIKQSILYFVHRFKIYWTRSLLSYEKLVNMRRIWIWLKFSQGFSRWILFKFQYFNAFAFIGLSRKVAHFQTCFLVWRTRKNN